MLKKERKETTKKHIINFIESVFVMCFTTILFLYLNELNQSTVISIIERIIAAFIFFSAICFIVLFVLLIFDIIRAIITKRTLKKIGGKEFKNVQIKGLKLYPHQVKILYKENYKAEAKMDKVTEAITLRIENIHGEVFNDNIDLYELAFNYTI